MASWWHQFHVKLVCVVDVVFHVLGYFVVKDVFLRNNARLFQSLEECIIFCIISASLQLFMGSTRMALVLISTITMIYLWPCCDHVGNWPVWLENMVSCTLYVLV